MPALKTLVEPEIKARFRRKAKKLGLSESELLRAVVLVVIDQDNDTDQIIESDAENAEVVRMTIRIPKFLKDGIEKRAKAKGMMLLNRWVAALIQSNLTGAPIMSDTELIALRASNRELAALGRNMNQIAKALNGSSYEIDQVWLDRLAELSRAIADNRNTIFALGRASWQSWDVK